MKTLAINGLGRIGKLFFISLMEKGVKCRVIINHPSDLNTIAYELKYDSIHDMPKDKISIKHNKLFYKNIEIPVYHERDPSLLPWKKEKVDLVVECTGKFTDAEEAKKHIEAGAKKVLISAPAKNQDKTIVFDINNSALKSADKIVSAGSCTTNCVAPMLYLLNKKFGIDTAYFITTHAYTSTQRLIDGTDEKDLRRGRAAAIDIIPTTSGASKSVIEVLPELKNKISGYALRVPVADGSFSSIIANLKKKTSINELNSLFKEASKKQLKRILSYNTEPIISSDIIHNPASCIYDANFTEVLGKQVSIAGWYDNEWGYSNRLVDVAMLMLK